MPFGSMAEIQSFAQFLVDHHSHPVMPSFVLLLCKFGVFTYNVVNYFCLFLLLTNTFYSIVYCWVSEMVILVYGASEGEALCDWIY